MPLHARSVLASERALFMTDWHVVVFISSRFYKVHTQKAGEYELEYDGEEGKKIVCVCVLYIFISATTNSPLSEA
jgi:hypothetical protein